MTTDHTKQNYVVESYQFPSCVNVGRFCKSTPDLQNRATNFIDQEKLFQTAIDLLVTHGYASTTTKKIAAAAGIHEATLFRKYGNKFGLIAKAIEQRLSDTPLHKLVYTGVLQSDLLEILQAYTEVSEHHGEIMPVLLFEISRDPALEKLLHTPWKNIQQIIDIIEKYQAQGQLKKEPPLTTLNVLIGPIMVNHMVQRANTNLPLPTIDLHQYVYCAWS